MAVMRLTADRNVDSCDKPSDSLRCKETWESAREAIMITLPEGAHMQNLNRVVAELKSEQQRLERQLQQVKRAVAVLQGFGTRSSGRGTRKLSAAGRARIAAAQRARWARVRAGKRK